MVGRVLAALLLLSTVGARKFLDPLVKLAANTENLDASKPWIEKWFTVKLDHFTYSDTNTFQMKYVLLNCYTAIDTRPFSSRKAILLSTNHGFATCLFSGLRGFDKRGILQMKRRRSGYNKSHCCSRLPTFETTLLLHCSTRGHQIVNDRVSHTFGVIYICTHTVAIKKICHFLILYTNSSNQKESDTIR
ncbi:unnamed protein product [Nippostrongylus brasiliensis]|uniref:Lipocalin n=1 Tax=Nippostrongylus brasiliensis TaxID=27835 RepID=A0A0N4YLL1_NIPBR|nr:unnamed protein product [Nippostrongylus brasiliensis]